MHWIEIICKVWIWIFPLKENETNEYSLESNKCLVELNKRLLELNKYLLTFSEHLLQLINIFYSL